MNNYAITAFNVVFNCLLGYSAAVVIIVALLFRYKSEKAKRAFVAVFYFIAFLYFFYYKYMLSLDAEYSAIQYEIGNGGFSWYNELPLNLCNITLMITPIAMLFDSRLLKSFIFYISPIGAALALLMPSAGFGGYSIFLPRVAGFYITHFAAFIAGPMIFTLGLYKPMFKDVLKCFMTFMIIATVVFIINAVMRLTGINEYSNYFFLMYPDGNPILEMLYKYIPCPGLYVLPAGIAGFIPIMYIETIIFSIFRKKKTV